MITLFAAKVRQGTPPKGYLRKDFADFRFIEHTIPDYFKLKRTLPEKALKALREACHDNILKEIARLAERHRHTLEDLWRARKAQEYLTYFQVLSPMRKGELGVARLNALLQEVLNPSQGKELTVGERRFRVRDKVIHLVNCPLETIPVEAYKAWLAHPEETLLVRTRVFNGQLGVVIRLDEDGLDVLYPNEGYVARYDKLDLANFTLDHAFCMSVHKAQGSEFEHVVAPVTTAHYALLHPKLLYTAMTRAKTHLTLVGQPYAFELGVRRKADAERATLIPLLVQTSA